MDDAAKTDPSISAVDEKTELEEIRARIRELERENARLHASHETGTTRGTRRFSWRALASALLIILATVLIPLATIAGWATTELVDEEAFVNTFAPLSEHPVVRAEIVKHTTGALEKELEIDHLVDSVFDGLQSLNMPTEANAALEMLREPAINGTHSLINSAVTELVHSEIFSDTWEVVLTASHRALVVAASGSAGEGEITIGADGDIVLHLGPVIADVKESLLAQGFDLAQQIPEVNATMKLAHSDALAYVAPIYHSAVTLGWVLPFASLALFLAGIAVSKRRHVAVLGVGVGLVLGAGATLLLVSAAGATLTAQASLLGVSPTTVETVFGQVVSRLTETSNTLILLGVLIIFIAWITGASTAAKALSGTVQSGTASLASKLYERGFNGGAVGQRLLSQRVFTRSVLVVLVVFGLVLLPVTVSTVLWLTLITLLIWWILALLEAVAARQAADETIEPELVRDDTSAAEEAAEQQASATE